MVWVSAPATFMFGSELTEHRQIQPSRAWLVLFQWCRVDQLFR